MSGLRPPSGKFRTAVVIRDLKANLQQAASTGRRAVSITKRKAPAISLTAVSQAGQSSATLQNPCD